MGAPIGNWNRLVHGKRSKRVKAERRAAWQAKFEEERRRADEWIKSQPPVNYGRVIDELIRLRAEQEAESGAWKSIRRK